MNLLDLGIIATVVLAVMRGREQGAALQFFTFGGFWLGLIGGAAAAPALSGLGASAFSASFLSLFAFFGVAMLGAVIGRLIGTTAFTTLRQFNLGGVDSAVGAAFSAVATLLIVWLVALMLAVAPTRALSAAINQSTIVQKLVATLPPAPNVFAQLRGIITTYRFPQVFEGLEPPITEPVDLPDDPVVRAAVDAAGASTVRVFGPGCGGIQTGTGFVAANGLVVTNAHVVAGLDQITVQDRAGRHSAEAVVFDPNLDIAVLRTLGLAGPPLKVSGTEVGRGTQGAFLGFPGGQTSLDAQPAAVARKFDARGRDIYNRNQTNRGVYQLQGQVREGNSGGPLVTSDGTVFGVIFAASTTDRNVGYAITSPQVVPLINRASGGGSADTGPCAA